VLVLNRATLEDKTQPIEIFEQQRRGIAHQQRVSRVYDIRRGQPVVHEP
jgi:hypothetical protein